MTDIREVLPTSLRQRLTELSTTQRRSEVDIIRKAVAKYLDLHLHTVFQVSTSGALVAGVYDEEVKVDTVLQHGDFGLGTFADLDGEMIVLDGQAYKAHGSGEVTIADTDAGAPFAVVTKFTADEDRQIASISDFGHLKSQCDENRTSQNIFYAVRLDGRFKRIRTRAVTPPPPGTPLVDAAKSQSESEFTDISGSLVGFWSPQYSGTFSVPGYHFHFLSDDRKHGGHLLEVESEELRLRVDRLTDFHLVLPETESFLQADLSEDPTKALASAEGNQ